MRRSPYHAIKRAGTVLLVVLLPFSKAAGRQG
jgi:hypothetical protein